jgi:hypothetical protein
MADSHTTRGRYRQQSLGARLNAWGLSGGLNGNYDALDEAIHGVETITVSGSVTLSTANLTTDQARNFGFRFVGSPATAVAVTVPSIEGRYAMRNATGVTLTVKTSAGAGYPLRTGTGALLISDGITCLAVGDTPINLLPTATGNASMNGFQIQNVGSPTASSDAVPLAFMNAAIANAAIPAASGAVLVSATDTTAGYLSTTLVAGNRVTLTVLNPGADETLSVAVADSAIGAAAAAASTPVAAAIFSPLDDFEEVIGLITALSA